MRAVVLVALAGLALAGCASDAQLQALHEAEIAKRDGARSQAVSGIEAVRAVLTDADFEKCRETLRNRWHIFGGGYEANEPLTPDVRYTCATARNQGWFEAEKPTRAAFVTLVTRIDASGDRRYKMPAFCVFEMKRGKVVNVIGEIGELKRHIRDTCHSV